MCVVWRKKAGFTVTVLFYRTAQEPAEGIRPGYSLQHRLSWTLPVAPAVSHSQAACEEGGVCFWGTWRKTFLQHHRLREGVPPPSAPEQQAGGTGGDGGVARWGPGFWELQQQHRRWCQRWRQPDQTQRDGEDTAPWAAKDGLHLYRWHHRRPRGLGCHKQLWRTGKSSSAIKSLTPTSSDAVLSLQKCHDLIKWHQEILVVRNSFLYVSSQHFYSTLFLEIFFRRAGGQLFVQRFVTADWSSIASTNAADFTPNLFPT